MPASYFLDAELFTLKSFHLGPFLTHRTQSGSGTEEAYMHNNESRALNYRKREGGASLVKWMQTV
jgi:hypothetical protein